VGVNPTLRQPWRNSLEAAGAQSVKKKGETHGQRRTRALEASTKKRTDTTGHEVVAHYLLRYRHTDSNPRVCRGPNVDSLDGRLETVEQRLAARNTAHQHA